MDITARELTLNEKISIKGVLERRGLHHLAGLNMGHALRLWYYTFPPRYTIGDNYFRYK